MRFNTASLAKVHERQFTLSYGKESRSPVRKFYPILAALKELPGDNLLFYN